MKQSTHRAATLLYGLAALGLVFLISRPFFAVRPLFVSYRLGILCLSSLFLYLGSRSLSKSLPEERARHIMRRSFWILFVLYLLFLLDVTLLDIDFGRNLLASFGPREQGAHLRYWTERTNFVPFHTIGNYIRFYAKGGAHSMSMLLSNVLGNLLAFAPLSFFLPLLFPKIRSFWRCLLCVTLFVSGIELLQLALMLGSCDIDDLILNVGGAALCYLVLKIPPIRTGIARLTGLPQHQTTGRPHPN